MPGAAGVAVAQKQRGRIGDFGQALAGHLEHADLVGGAEAVLHRAQHAEMMAALAFEIEHRIDQMLDRLGAGDLAVLGDMADQDQRRAGGFGIAHQIEAGGAHLGDGAGRGIQRPGPQGLDGIDGDDAGRLAAFERGQNVFDIGGGAQHRAAPPTSPCGRRACAPAPSPLRRRYRPRGRRFGHIRPAPAGSGWICRCRDRRRPAAPNPAPARRRRRGRIRRCR